MNNLLKKTTLAFLLATSGMSTVMLPEPEAKADVGTTLGIVATVVGGAALAGTAWNYWQLRQLAKQPKVVYIDSPDSAPAAMQAPAQPPVSVFAPVYAPNAPAQGYAPQQYQQAPQYAQAPAQQYPQQYAQYPQQYAQAPAPQYAPQYPQQAPAPNVSTYYQNYITSPASFAPASAAPMQMRYDSSSYSVYNGYY